MGWMGALLSPLGPNNPIVWVSQETERQRNRDRNVDRNRDGERDKRKTKK